MNQSKFKVNACSWHKARENLCERVTRTTCGPWLRISRSHSYDSPLESVLRFSLGSSRGLLSKRETARGLRKSNKYFAFIFLSSQTSMRNSQDTRANRENSSCFLRKHTLVVALLYPWLIYYHDPLSSTANPSREFVGGRSVWRRRQNGWFIQDRDIKTRYRWIEYFLLNCNVL